jgi:hypothetical protein
VSAPLPILKPKIISALSNEADFSSTTKPVATLSSAMAATERGT